MNDNEISADVRSTTGATTGVNANPRAPLTARLLARLRTGKFDRMLAVGVPAPEGSALAAHEARLMSAAEREAVARSLRQAVVDAGHGGALMPSRIRVHVTNVVAAEGLIDEITLRLDSPRPVRGRGMARLRRILSDGYGPLYHGGRGDLAGRLGAALAAL